MQTPEPAPIPAVAEYFGSAEIPTVTAVFSPGVGWHDYPTQRPIDLALALQLQALGITQVALELPPQDRFTRVADFSIDELLITRDSSKVLL